MIIEAKLEVSNHTIDADFGVVQVASDGGYEKGYDDGETAGYEKGHADGYADALEETAADNEEIALQADLLQQISTELEGKTGTSGYKQGYEEGKAEAIAALPDGYIKVDPTWTNFAQLCSGRRYSLGENLKYSDTANGTNFSQMFYGWDDGGMHIIPSLDLRNGVNFQSMFHWSARIVEIGEMDISNATNVINMFANCSELERISFVPFCIKLSIEFGQSNKMNKASIQSIVTALSTTTTGLTVTLSLEAVNNAFETSEGAADGSTSEEWLALIATRENWTVSLV